MYSKALLSVFILLSSFRVYPQTAYSVSHGGTGNDRGKAACLSEAGTLVVAAETNSFASSSNQIYLLELDTSDGSYINGKFFGGDFAETITDIVLHSNGHYYLTGYTNHPENGYDGFLYKVDAALNPVWRKTFGGAGWDFLRAIAETSSGDLLGVGDNYSDGLYCSVGWVLNLNAEGEENYEVTLPENFCTQLNAVILRNDTAFFAGSTFVADSAQAVIYTHPLNGVTAQLLWQDEWKTENSIQSLAWGNTRLLAAGTARETSDDASYIFSKQVSPESASVFFPQEYGGPLEARAGRITHLTGGNVVIAGTSASFGEGGQDLVNYVFSQSNTYISGTSFGSEDQEELHDLIALANNQFALIGTTSGFGFNDQVLVVVSGGEVLTVDDHTNFLDNSSTLDVPAIENGCTVKLISGTNEVEFRCILEDWGLYTMQGTLAASGQGRTNRIALPVGLAKGVYLLTFYTNNSRQTLKLFIGL